MEPYFPGSDRSLTFHGKATVQIPAGAPMLSDPIDLNIPALAKLAISLYVPKESLASTFHQLGQMSTLISGPGDFTTAPVLANAAQTHSWYFLSDLEVRSPEQASALVTLGDSITDGFGGKPGGYEDWPDVLADRLAQSTTAPAIAIDNEGIGGNRILYDGAGVNALARFDRDVLAKPGVTTIIVPRGHQRYWLAPYEAAWRQSGHDAQESVCRPGCHSGRSYRGHGAAC